MLATLLTVLPLMGTALAHLQMKSPLPIDSPLGAGQPKNGMSLPSSPSLYLGFVRDKASLGNPVVHR